METINQIEFCSNSLIWHTDQGSPYGASITVEALLQKGFTISMSRAGTPTDNGYAERFVGIFKLAVIERRKYESVNEFVSYAQDWINFYNNERHHNALGGKSPNQYARIMDTFVVPNISLSNCTRF